MPGHSPLHQRVHAKAVFSRDRAGLAHAQRVEFRAGNVGIPAVDLVNNQQDLVRQGSHIYFTCATSDNKVKNISPLQNPGKINLINTYDGDIFTAPLFTNHIKPFSNSIISDSVKIYADDKRDIIFISDLDLDDNDTTKGKKINSEKGYIKIASKLAFSDEYKTTTQ